MKFSLFRRTAYLVSLLGMVCFEGCVVGPKYKPPVTQAPAAYKEAMPQQAPDGSTWRPAKPNDAALRGSWWRCSRGA